MFEVGKLVLTCGACGSPRDFCGCRPPEGPFTGPGQCVVYTQQLSVSRCVGVRLERVAAAYAAQADLEVAVEAEYRDIIEPVSERLTPSLA